MIIARYIGHELTRSLIAVTCIMVFIFACNDMIRYLHYIASGKYAAWVLVHVILLQLPILFGLLLPLGFFLGLLLSYARMYADSEMVVLAACGFSQWRLFKLTMGFAVIVALISGLLSLWVKPLMQHKSRDLLAHAEAASIVSIIQPGRFRTTNHGREVYYVRQLSRDHQQLKGLFFAQKGDNGQWKIMVAHSGQVVKRHGKHYLQAQNGHLYMGKAGQPSFKQVDYQRYGVFLDNNKTPKADYGVKSHSTWDLWKNRDKPDYRAALQWRLSVPIMVFVLALIAFPLSYIKPRQGRFAKLMPGVLIYIVYANLMFVGREWIENSVVPGWLGLWWIHGIFLIVGLILMKQRFAPGRLTQKWN